MAAANKNNPASADSWSEYRRLVLAELERLDNAVSKLTEVSLDHEKNLLETSNAVKNDVYGRVSLVKEELVDKVRKMIDQIRTDLTGYTTKEVNAVEATLNAIERKVNRISTDLKVLKGKAAILGFAAGLLVAVVSLIAQLFWNR